MPDAPSTVVQNVLKKHHPPIRMTTHQEASITRAVLQAFLDTVEDGAVGVAPAYGTNCVLSVIAFASSTDILIVRLSKRKEKRGKTKKRTSRPRERDFLQELIFDAQSLTKFAFQMDLRIPERGSAVYSEGRSLFSISDYERDGREVGLNKSEIVSLFQCDEKVSKAPEAWCAWRAATISSTAQRWQAQPRIDTSTMPEAHLSILSKLVRDARCLSALKPTRVTNEIEKDHTCKKGRLDVTSTRFKTRVMCTDQRLEIRSTAKSGRTVISGQVTRVNGRAAQINLKSALPDGNIKVTTVGKEPPTNAEEEQAAIIRRALQGTGTISKRPFFQAIWLPQETPLWPATSSSSHLDGIHFPHALLNNSQKRAVTAILSDKRITVVHGPPGTGKTTVIAAAVTSISATGRGKTVWLLAQSNVAVKNIAEKLASVGFFDFKIVVSKGVFFWHLYQKIEPNLITSNQIMDSIVACERQLTGSKVILCTLSMLSSPKISTVARIVPLETVIVDEASQVEIGNYLPMIDRFHKSLQKLVFIGDDKQLAPYGQGTVESLQSIFEIPHLRKGAVFLDTQYRLVSVGRFRVNVHLCSSMPHQLGGFISKYVYGNKLKTVHPIATPCCFFLDVKQGKETKQGSSWIVGPVTSGHDINIDYHPESRRSQSRDSRGP
ncbi:hypothetical protein B0H10DRAFT_2065061 [Mycena sp. CBHHK59/15]|nr:hypothetical protein B0H10DRAFT_2065061 [Mycena sp. CBHHK59/15]